MGNVISTEEFRNINNTLDVMHDDVTDRFAENCGLLSISCIYNEEMGVTDSELRISGNAEELAWGLAEAMRQHPEIILLIQDAVVKGDAETILTNFTNFLRDQLSKDDDYDS